MTRQTPVNVAVFTDNDFAKVNGVTTTLSALLRYAPSGVRPRIYTHSDMAADEPEYLALGAPGMGIPFYREMKIHLPRFRRLCASARRDGSELVHLTTPGPVGLAALYVAAKLGVPLIGSFHTDLGSYVRMLSGSARLERWVRLYMRWMYGRCERIFVPSDATGRMLSEDGVDPARVALWVRGVDTDAFSPRRRSAALRRAWGLDGAGAAGDAVALVYAGRVSREKGLAILPEVERRLRAAGVAHRWIVVGDGPYRRNLEGQLGNAAFMGKVVHADVARPLASADVFVFPSCTDTAGNVVLEAQACGLPVLVADQGGPRENMLPDESGFVCRGGRAKDFADAIVGLASNPARRRALSAGALRYARSRSWRQALAPLYAAYRDVAAQRRTGGAASPRAIRAAVLPR